MILVQLLEDINIDPWFHLPFFTGRLTNVSLIKVVKIHVIRNDFRMSTSDFTCEGFTHSLLSVFHEEDGQLISVSLAHRVKFCGKLLATIKKRK